MPFVSSVRGTFGPISENKGVGKGLAITETLRQNPGAISGGIITEAGGYRIHTFTNVGASTFNSSGFSQNLSAEILMVGGGGAAGNYAGGGGGGEVLFITRSLSPGSYPLSVGAGGVGAISSYQVAFNGSPTTGFSETAKPGGGSKSSDDTSPASGQSDANNVNTGNATYSVVANGGGGSSRSSGYFGSLGTSVGSGVTRFGGNRGGQDYQGGGSPNNGPNYPGGGGGGAGGSVSGNTGGTTSDNSSGRGGPGVASSILGTQYYWGGGGGGGVYYNNPTTTAGSGGIGGGGGGGNVSPGLGGAGYNNGQAGQSVNPHNGGNAGANTGGGGGAGRGETSGRGGDGGSGIIVVRYPI